MEKFNDIIGLTIDQAEEKVKDRVINSIRALNIDGQEMFGTMDYRINRLNVSIENGLIVSIIKIG